MNYHITVEGPGFILACKRVKKTDDLSACRDALRKDPSKADFYVQGPDMEANVTITNEDGDTVMEGTADDLNFCEPVDGDVPADLSTDDVLVTCLCPAAGIYVDEDFESDAELDETGSCTIGEDEVGVGGEYVSGVPSLDGHYVLTKMTFAGKPFSLLKVEPTGGEKMRIYSSDLETINPTEGPYMKYVPWDEQLAEIVDRNHDALYPEDDEKDVDTGDAESDILAYIGDLDLNDFELVDDFHADGLYINPDDTDLYELKKSGRTILGFS